MYVAKQCWLSYIVQFVFVNSVNWTEHFLLYTRCSGGFRGKVSTSHKYDVDVRETKTRVRPQ